MIYKSNQHIKNNYSSKSIYMWMHSRKLLNKYFFYKKNYIKLNINIKLIKGFLILPYIIFFKKKVLLDFYSRLPKNISLKQILINFYSVLFLSYLTLKDKKAIFIIGDINYPSYNSLMLASCYFKKIDIWIIYQGIGSIQKKINFKYPLNVKKIFFPFSKGLFYENSIIKNASLKYKVEFLNIDTTLKIKISNKVRNLAIFQGYNKNIKLYPLYIFRIVKILLEIVKIKDLNKFDLVFIFLHPRISYLENLNLIIFNKKIIFKIHDNSKYLSFKYIISYSPTINSSIKLENYQNKYIFKEDINNFNIENIKSKIKQLNI